MRQLVNPVFARGLRVSFGLDPCTSRRRIHATPPESKSVKEKLSEVADKVNKKVGEGLATAIETGEKATEKTKKTLEARAKRANSGKAKGAKGGADQMGQEAKEAGHDVVEAAKGTRTNGQKDA